MRTGGEGRLGWPSSLTAGEDEMVSWIPVTHKMVNLLTPMGSGNLGLCPVCRHLP